MLVTLPPHAEISVGRWQLRVPVASSYAILRLWCNSARQWPQVLHGQGGLIRIFPAAVGISGARGDGAFQQLRSEAKRRLVQDLKVTWCAKAASPGHACGLLVDLVDPLAMLRADPSPAVEGALANHSGPSQSTSSFRRDATAPTCFRLFTLLLHTFVAV